MRAREAHLGGGCSMHCGVLPCMTCCITAARLLPFQTLSQAGRAGRWAPHDCSALQRGTAIAGGEARLTCRALLDAYSLVTLAQSSGLPPAGGS